MVSTNRKKSPNKSILLRENRFPITRMANLFKNTFLLDEKIAYIFGQSWQLKLFSAQKKFIFRGNSLFWLVKTDFLGSPNHFFSNLSNILSTGSSFSISWMYILNKSFITVSGNGFLFNGNNILSFIFSLFETIVLLERNQY